MTGCAAEMFARYGRAPAFVPKPASQVVSPLSKSLDQENPASLGDVPKASLGRASERVAMREVHASSAQEGDRRDSAARPSPGDARVTPLTESRWSSASAAAAAVGDVAEAVARFADGPSSVHSPDGGFFAAFASRGGAERSARTALGSAAVDSGSSETRAHAASAAERRVLSAPA